MDYTKISEITKGTLQGFYLVKTAAVRDSAKGNSRYGDYTLADESGEINAKIWDYDNYKDAKPEPGQILKIQATANEWQGKLQLRIERSRVATADDPVDMAAMIPTAPEAPAAMLHAIEGYVQQIEHEEIRELVQYMLEENNAQLLIWPAAVRNHHSVRSGLLYHTVTMLRMAEGMRKIYPFLRKDLLYAGAILHDLAKIRELNAAESGIATEYTREGQLLGHIVQGILMIERAAQELGISPEAVTLLQHMLLSHHYEPEYGSPRRPMFAEAEALHYLDVLDARMYDFQKIQQSTPEDGFSERQFSLHNRQIYHIPDQLV